MAKKELIGKVVSTYQKTAVVKVERDMLHPLYLKRIKRTTKLYAHDEKMLAKVGDTVRVRETRPISKLKRWVLVEVLTGGERK